MKRILVLSLCLAMLSTVIGCASPAQPAVDVDQLIAGATIAMEQVNTCKMAMSMPITIEVAGGAQPGKATLTTAATAELDIANREMHMTINMSMSYPGQARQDVVMEVYIAGDWAYTKSGDRWLKVKLTEAMWQQQSQVQRQMELLQTAAKVVLKDNETVNGIDCYLLQVVPDMTVLGRLLTEQAAGTSGMDFSQLDLANIMKDVSLRSWLARDSLYLIKSDVSMSMEILPADLGATEKDFNKMTASIGITITLSEYNQPVPIVLPPEAAAAADVTSSFRGP